MTLLRISQLFHICNLNIAIELTLISSFNLVLFTVLKIPWCNSNFQKPQKRDRTWFVILKATNISRVRFTNNLFFFQYFFQLFSFYFLVFFQFSGNFQTPDPLAILWSKMFYRVLLTLILRTFWLPWMSIRILTFKRNFYRMVWTIMVFSTGMHVSMLQLHACSSHGFQKQKGKLWLKSRLPLKVEARRATGRTTTREQWLKIRMIILSETDSIHKPCQFFKTFKHTNLMHVYSWLIWAFSNFRYMVVIKSE